MSHIRKQIRDAVRAAIVASAPGYTVFTSRVDAISPDELPAIVITTPDEALERDTVSSPLAYARDLALQVDGYVLPSDALDDALDEVGLVIEMTLATVGLLDGLLRTEPILQRISTEIDGDAQQTVGRIRHLYALQAGTRAGSPSTPA